MLLLVVPDEPEELTENGDGDSGSSQQLKAQLDDSEASKASQKVDLDLDDAPFLEDEDEDEEDIEDFEEAPLEEEKEEKPKRQLPAFLRNKLFYMGLLILALLIIIAVLLFSRSPAPPEQPETETKAEEPAEPQPQTPTPEPEVQEPEDILLRLDPFLVEQLDEDGNIRFLEIRIVLTTQDQQMALQFNQETFTVRNALYYYLKNKDLTFLTEEKYGDKLKEELLAVINQYIGVGRFDTILFEQYLVR
ncbi:flagellar basal body-associated FliL family protein [Desulfovibrio oxyclinae]|uniref:flagellar basal body-associated FliL family protein n=1 Tax=Desulfovibrio oxyclinae TaxID=63560 RepID=UPI000371C6F5|nr:flagellar basal body-associated FliL family protein [Desulfovibrio oxyclinae]